MRVRKDDTDPSNFRRRQGEGVLRGFSRLQGRLGTPLEPGLPLYMQVSKDGCVLHLSEHHGDCSPGAALRIETSDLDAFHGVLASKRYEYARPGIEEMPWGTRDMSVKDPFGNRFTTALEKPGT